MVARLIAQAPLAVQIGNRLHAVQLPQGSALPAIAYSRVSRKATQHRGSPRAQHNRSRFQFDIWAATYGDMQAAKTALMDALAQLQGGSPRIDVALVRDDRYAYETEPGRWRAIVDYYIWHEGD